MIKRKPPSGSNLFAIDHDAILSILQDANQKLLERRDALMAAFRRAPETISTDDDVAKCRLFLHQLQNALSESRQARLSDGKPLRSAALTVRKFFQGIDEPLEEAYEAIRDRLTRTAMNVRRKGADIRPVTIAIGVEGSEIVTSMANSASRPQSSLGIRLEWTVAEVDCELVDLEALRPFLTPASIMAACKKHLAEHGPHHLRGAKYIELASDRVFDASQ